MKFPSAFPIKENFSKKVKKKILLFLDEEEESER